MADIKELGESLLQRQRDRNDQIYNRSRKEAYKLALGTAGVGLLNDTLVRKAQQFMVSEPMMAQKAKYRAATAQAQNIVNMNNQIIESGFSPEQYFMNTRYLPMMEEEWKATYGEQFVPTAYLPQLREEAQRLAKEEATRFTEALAAAQSLPDYETAISSLTALTIPPTNAGQSLLQKVKGIFTGKSADDFRRDAIARVEEQGLIKNDTFRALFNTMSEDEGIDAAVNFVRRLDTRGFTEATNLERKTEIFKNDDGSYDVISTVVAKDGTGDVTVTRDRMDAPTRTDEVVQFADGTPYIVERRTSEGRTEVVDIRSDPISIDTPEGQMQMAKSLMDMSNPNSIAQDTLNARGYLEYTRLLNERGLSGTDIRTPEQFAAVNDVLQSISANLDWLKDDEATRIKAEVYSTALGGLNNLLMQLSSPSTDDATRRELEDRIDQYIRSFGEAATGRPITPALPDNRPRTSINRTNTLSWDELP